ITTRLKAIHSRPYTAQNTSIGDKTRLWRGLVVASVFCLPFASQAGETINYTGSSSDLTTGTLAGSDNAPGSVYSTSSTSGNSVTVNSAAGADPYRVFGGLSDSATVTNNSVHFINGSILNNLYGGYDVGGFNAAGNSVVMSAGLVGGYLLGAISLTAEVVGNCVRMDGGTVTNNIYGGSANGAGKAENNTVIMTGGLVKTNLIGGFSASGTATNNIVTIKGGEIRLDVYGADSGSGNVTGNTVMVEGGKITVGIYGGNSWDGDATGNTVTVKGGEIGQNVLGGNSGGIVTKNTVMIEGGEIAWHVYGGRSWGSTVGGASDNTVTISGGKINGNVYGGNSDSFNTTGNTVTISGNPVLSTAVLYGGFSSSLNSSADHFSGNTLNVQNGGMLVKGIANFENYNFSIPATLASGGTMLTVTNAVDLTNTNINARVAKSSQLGQYILIQSTGGITGTPNGPLGSAPSAGTPGDYILTKKTITQNTLSVDQSLAWNASGANAALAHGTFTLDAGESFEIDTPLNNQAANAATGWDGQSLSKNGDGQLTLSGQTNWTGNTSLNAGTLTLDGSAGGAHLVGDIVGRSGSSFRLVNGASFTGSIDPTDVVITGPNSVWNDTGASVIDSLTLVSGGNYGFTAPVGGVYKTLNINGSLNGNGNITMNTNLGAQQGDRIVAHETAGQHSVTIRNQGGDPSGPGQSLKLIEVSTPGLSNGTFVLPSGQVDVGAYRYGLLRGEQLAGGDAGDWYLANTLEKSNLTNGVLAAANTAKYATFASLNNLHKRLGELRLDQSGDAGNDLWMRAYEKRYTLHLDGSVDQKVDGFEAGYDHQFRFDGGRFYAGALAGGGQSRIDSNRDGSGSIDNNQIGAYATWILDNGFYVDLIGRHFWFRHDYNLQPQGSTLPETGSADNTAWSLDVETGKRFDCKDGWYLEPQAELNWLRNSRAGFTSSLGNRITLDSSQTVNGRLGLAGGKVLTSDTGRLTQVYGRLDWSKDLSSDGRVAINGNSFDAVKDDGAWTAAIGVQTAGGEQDRLQFYTEVEAGLGSPAVKQNWGVNVGLRWSF
ncbi:MAG: autotransporter outer membrane beta-barrel domain-containing protein, partial [Desulfocapsaceae bacterium]|nr:autotransporter outer membrane beta-barrel domain-containing protein [Desulfocapsaceae bacterium]